MGAAIPRDWSSLAAPAAVPEPQALREPLQRYLRALWNLPAAMRYGEPPAPFIVGRTIHLPMRAPVSDRAAAWHWYRAAAAHAAAHLAYSPSVFDGRGLGPIARALLGLLEDARVEALATRELPGLRRLWSALHTATPLDGDGFEALMLRLARGLIDPACDDPHPWVRKGRRLFFVDDEMQVLALRRPDELRRAATLLGHDIGQMRLAFNPRLHVPGPDYRDDLRWMWPTPHDREERSSAALDALSIDGDSAAQGPPADDLRDVAGAELYPEWDRLIARLRPRWCAVFESPADPVADPAAAAPVDRLAHPLRAPLRRVLQQVRVLDGVRGAAGDDGDRLDLDALVRARVASRLRLPVDDRLLLRAARVRPRGRAVVLVDQSASSAGPWGRSGMSLLQAACEVAALTVDALESLGTSTALCGFCSNGRRDVRLLRVKDFGQPLGPSALAGLAALHSRHSTRLGAVIRHAARRLLMARGKPGARQLLIISDGQPHDVDVHDPRYLPDDARQAVLQAARRGVRVVCIVLDPGCAALARRVFGGRRVGVLQALAGLPPLARRLAI